MNTLIEVVEVWVPDSEGHLLEVSDARYGAAAGLAAASRSMCFGLGEGLPGRVWDEGRPIILKDLQAGYFRRAVAAAAAGLRCAVAFPVFLGDQLKAVVVLFCGGDAQNLGAVELWRNDPRVTTDMTLLDAYYASTTAAFESASRDTFLPRGAGLPGLAWQRQGAIFIEGLSMSKKFVRTEEAVAAGFQRGLALPCPVLTRENYVLSFLSSSTTPIAARTESWVLDAAGQSFQRAFGYCEQAGSLPVGAGALPSASEHDLIAAAFTNAVPRLRRGSVRPPGAGGSAWAVGELDMLALPIASEGTVAEVLALYF